jgi:adenylate kinase
LYIIFLGAPGAGKGTQAVVVAQKLKSAHVASGDLFRQALEQGTDLGVQARAYMEKGQLVPDEITTRMVLEKIAAPESDAGVILDGFPRNLGQAEALDKALAGKNKGIDKVVYIKVPEKELQRRLGERWVCRHCQAVYSARQNGKCDRCDGELYQRPDDTAETVQKRLEIYFAQTAPLIDYYTRKGRLLEVDGEGSVDEVTGRIEAALHEEGLVTG